MNRSGRRLPVNVLVIVCACALTFAASPGDTNERDELGATRLMHAAAFGSLDAVRSLIDGGANVNATAANGATALMWAAGDPDKVRVLMLMDHGGDGPRTIVLAGGTVGRTRTYSDSLDASSELPDKLPRGGRLSCMSW